MPNIRFHSSRTTLVFLISSVFIGGSGKLDVAAQNTSATTTERGEQEPRKNPSYYLEKYGTQPVQAILNGKDHIIIDGWIQETDRGRFIQTVSKDGDIKYRKATVFNLEPFSRKWFRVDGGGYHGHISPHINLRTGNSYIFQLKPHTPKQYSMRIRAKDPSNFNFYKVYDGVEILNNTGKSQFIRFTPTQNSPDEIEFSFFGQRVTPRPKFGIGKTPNPTTPQPDQIKLKVDIPNYLKKLHLDLQTEGFFPEEMPEKQRTLKNLYAMVAEQFKAQEKWYEQIEKQEALGYRLLFVQTNPTQLLKGVPEVSASLLEERRTRNYDKNGTQSDGKKYLVRYKIDRYGNRFVRMLMIKEEKILRRQLKVPESQFKGVHYYTRVSNSHVDEAARIRNEFEDNLDKFKNLTIEYAVEDAYLENTKNLVSAGKLDEAIKLLRPHTYPLVKLVGLPEFFGERRICNFKEPVIYLLNTFIKGYNGSDRSYEQKIGYLYEAFAIIYTINPDSQNPEFLKIAKELADLLESTGKPKDMARAKYLREHYLEVEE